MSVRCRLKSRYRRRTQTWKARRQQEFDGWNSIIEPLTDAYLSWKHIEPDPPDVASRSATPPTGPPTECTAEEVVPLTVTVLEVFTLQKSLTIQRPASSTSAPVGLASHGFLAKTPTFPEVAVGFRTLELFHRIRLRKPSLSVEAFTKVLCDYYEVCPLSFDCNSRTYLFPCPCKLPYRRYHRTILSDTYEIYLRILRVLDNRLKSVLGWDTPNWRVENSCRACCYKVSPRSVPKLEAMVI